MHTLPRIGVILFCLAGVVGAGDSGLQRAPGGVSANRPLYLYSHFRDNDVSHLRLSYSNDAVNWREVNPHGSLTGTAMRDSSVTYHEESGTFYFIVTPPPNHTQVQFFSSTDLTKFSAIQTLDMAQYVPGAVTAWAPEWWHDPKDGKYYFIVSVTTDPQGRTSSTAPMHPYLLPFDITTGKVNGQPQQIDVRGTTQGRTFDFFPYFDGKQYYLLYVDQQPGGTGGNVTQAIAYATSSKLEGPYTQQTLPGTDYFGLGTFQAEAPTIIRLGQTDCVRLVFDTWSVQSSGTRKYAPVYRDSCLSSGDLFSQTSLSNVATPLNIVAAEHGTIIALTEHATASIVVKAASAAAEADQNE